MAATELFIIIFIFDMHNIFNFSYVMSGTHDPEPTTLPCWCNGVFTDRFIFRLNFPRMRLPQEPDDQLQEIKLTSSGHRTGTAFAFGFLPNSREGLV